jgi:hypothetical protein
MHWPPARSTGCGQRSTPAPDYSIKGNSHGCARPPPLSRALGLNRLRKPLQLIQTEADWRLGLIQAWDLFPKGACHVTTSESSKTQKRFATIAAALADEPNVSIGSSGKKGFGSSALQVCGKIFAMAPSDGSFVVKLPKQRVEELENSGAGQRFDPGHGRLMKEWLALNASSSEDWLSLAKEALRFVSSKS